MEKIPVVEKEVVRTALFPLTGTVPKLCEPDWKMTDPVATDPYWLETVAVKVMDWSVPAGFSEEMTPVDVLV